MSYALYYWLYQQWQPMPCCPMVSMHQSKPMGNQWLSILSCPASATGPGLEYCASIKHGPGMCMHMLWQGSQLGSLIAQHNCTPTLQSCTAHNYEHHTMHCPDEALSHIWLCKAAGRLSCPQKNATRCISSCLQGPGGTPLKVLNMTLLKGMTCCYCQKVAGHA